MNNDLLVSLDYTPPVPWTELRPVLPDTDLHIPAPPKPPPPPPRPPGSRAAKRLAKSLKKRR